VDRIVAFWLVRRELTAVPIERSRFGHGRCRRLAAEIPVVFDQALLPRAFAFSVGSECVCSRPGRHREPVTCVARDDAWARRFTKRRRQNCLGLPTTRRKPQRAPALKRKSERTCGRRVTDACVIHCLERGARREAPARGAPELQPVVAKTHRFLGDNSCLVGHEQAAGRGPRQSPVPSDLCRQS